MVNQNKYIEIVKQLEGKIVLVAVSKNKPIEAISELYELGQRDFGENYVQELADKQMSLPKDIRWHFIGHLQTNKVKYIAGFVHLIHGIDSLKLLKEVNKQAEKNQRVIDVLIQVHIASEETKYGFDSTELDEILNDHASLAELKNIRITGFMGMASFSNQPELIRDEFRTLQFIFRKYQHPNNIQPSNFQPTILSMGMSSDYLIAIEEGSNMVRIGSLIFGER
ncbi:MAG: YggS family pyridoxal phosphate-dependent enzyme [Flavisolibacter sp.]